MPVRFKQGYARIIESRQKMLDARLARYETLQRFKNFAKAKLSDFVNTTDPVTGQRLVDLSAGGEKTRGEAAMQVAFFEGTRLRFNLDMAAQYTVETTPADMLTDVKRVIDIVVTNDLSRAELIYEPVGGPRGTRRRLDLVEVLAKMVEYAAAVVEDQLGDAALPAAPPAAPPAPAPARQPAAVTPPPRQTVSLSIS